MKERLGEQQPPHRSSRLGAYKRFFRYNGLMPLATAKFGKEPTNFWSKKMQVDRPHLKESKQ